MRGHLLVLTHILVTGLGFKTYNCDNPTPAKALRLDEVAPCEVRDRIEVLRDQGGGRGA